MASNHDRPPFRADRTPEPADIPRKDPNEKPNWIDHKKNVDRICYALYAVSAFLLIIDFWVHKHGPFAIEHVPGFYGIYGFVGCVFLVVAARGMRVILMRSEDYYDR